MTRVICAGLLVSYSLTRSGYTLPSFPYIYNSLASRAKTSFCCGQTLQDLVSRPIKYILVLYNSCQWTHKQMLFLLILLHLVYLNCDLSALLTLKLPPSISTNKLFILPHFWMKLDSPSMYLFTLCFQRFLFFNQNNKLVIVGMLWIWAQAGRLHCSCSHSACMYAWVVYNMDGWMTSLWYTHQQLT